MIGMQPSLSLSFWFKAWNTIEPGSFTVAQISKKPRSLFQLFFADCHYRRLYNTNVRYYLGYYCCYGMDKSVYSYNHTCRYKLTE